MSYKYINVKYANITVGDFNCPKVNWVGYTSCNDYIHSKFLNLVSTSGLCQFGLEKVPQKSV